MKINFSGNISPLKSLVLIFIFLAMLNTINAYYYFVIIAFAIFVLRRESKLIVNGSFCALLMLAMSLVIFSSKYSYSILGVLKTLTYLMCYVMGFGLIESENKDKKWMIKSFYTICFFVIAGSLVHYLLNWLSNLSNYETRNTIDYWTKRVLAATGQAPMACLSLALVVACLFSNVSKKLKAVAVAVLVMILAYNLILSGRTIFVMTIIVTIVAFIYKLTDKQTNKLRYVATIMVVILVVLAIFSFDLFGVRSHIESSKFYERFYGDEATMEVNEDGRMENKMQYIENALDYPFGGSNLHEQFGYAHDIYLDTYDEAGIFAFIAMVLYMFGTLFRLLKCIKRKDLPFEFRQIVLCIYVIIYVQFMVEPILQGMPWLFASFCVIDGGLSRLLIEFSGKKNLEGTDDKSSRD